MHRANQPYNVLDGAGLEKNGRGADSLERLNRYSDVLRSYCAKGDPICTNGDDVEKHLNYFELYTDDASTWAVGKFNEAAPLCDAAAPTPSASASVAPTSVGAAGTKATGGAAASNGTAPGKPRPSGAATLPGYPASPVKPTAPTSPVKVAPFPVPQKYEVMCLPKMTIKYVYV